MKILVTTLADLRRIPPQRPHHLITHLTARHELVVRSIQTSRVEDFHDEFIHRLLQRVDFGYFTSKYHHPLLQELSVSLNRSLKRWVKEQGFHLHLNLNSLIAGYEMGKMFYSKGLPTILDICDDLPERFSLSSHVPWGFHSAARVVTRHLMHRNIGIASRITFSGAPMGTAYGFPVSRSHLIPNGVDCDHFRPLPRDGIRDELGIAHDDFVCGYVGVFSDWTALDMVIEAISRLNRQHPSIKFLVVGDGEQFPYLQKLVRNAGISSQVIFTGRIPYQDVPIHISAMDVGLIPLRPTADCHHAHPMKLFEYMACETPVIATPLEGVCSIVGDRVLYAGSQEELMTRVLQLTKDETLRTTLGKVGRAFVKENYCWERILTRFDEILRDVIHEEIFAC